MKCLLSFIVTLVIFSSYRIFAQNFDLNVHHASGKYRAMAGAGIGGADDIFAFDLNPCGLSNAQTISLACAQSVRYHIYSLYRDNEGIGAINYDWEQGIYKFEHLLVALPISKKFVLGAGIVPKIHSFLQNRRRAITWSSLFEQNTTSNVYAFAASSGFQLLRQLSIGCTLYRYFGTITSKVTGKNHGKDIDKWATLQSTMSGMNCRLGLAFKLKKFGVGMILDLPHQLDVKATKKISDDKLYEYLFPIYENTTWHLPLTVGIGVAYSGIKNVVVTFDFENQQWQESDVQFNLYEFGSQPNWKNINIARAGLEFFPFGKEAIPIRLGYAYVPQFYASNIAVGYGDRIVECEETRQNIKNVLTTGTSLIYQNFLFHISFEYSRLTWQRDLETRMLVHDDFTEQVLTVSVDLSYQF